MNIFRALIEAVRRHRRRELTYRELMALDDHQLSDLGITRSMIARVAMLGSDGPTEVRQAECEVEGFSNINTPWAEGKASR